MLETRVPALTAYYAAATPSSDTPPSPKRPLRGTTFAEPAHPVFRAKVLKVESGGGLISTPSTSPLGPAPTEEAGYPRKRSRYFFSRHTPDGAGR